MNSYVFYPLIYSCMINFDYCANILYYESYFFSIYDIIFTICIFPTLVYELDQTEFILSYDCNYICVRWKINMVRSLKRILYMQFGGTICSKGIFWSYDTNNICSIFYEYFNIV